MIRRNITGFYNVTNSDHATSLVERYRADTHRELQSKITSAPTNDRTAPKGPIDYSRRGIRLEIRIR